MKRQHFMKACLVMGAFMASPFSAIAKSIRKFRNGNGFPVSSGKDRFEKPLTLLQGDTFFTKISPQGRLIRI